MAVKWAFLRLQELVGVVRDIAGKEFKGRAEPAVVEPGNNFFAAFLRRYLIKNYL